MPTTYSSATTKAPKASQSGIPVVVDASEMTRLARDLKRAAPEVYAAFRGELRAVAQVVATEAKSRASFSTRIPATIKVRAGVGTVKVVAGGPGAPDAAPLENKGRAGTFRHPVFGDRNVWVEQQARPFLAPALEAHRETVATGIEVAVVRAVERALGAI
jgi:hypothetical protein